MRMLCVRGNMNASVHADTAHGEGVIFLSFFIRVGCERLTQACAHA